MNNEGKFKIMKYGTYKGENVNGWYASEKLDGIYALWDGGYSRGYPISEIPYANKDGRVKVSTGLFSSRGNVICAPDDWIRKNLPERIALEMELWVGRRQFQTVSSICRKFEPDWQWEQVKPMIFNIPPNHYYGTKKIYFKDLINDIRAISKIEYVEINNNKTHLDDLMNQVISNGGEGLVLRAPFNTYKTTGRSKSCLKYKAIQDGECEVIGHIAGTGKYIGKLGAYLVKWGSVIFEIGTGMDDYERANPLPIGSIFRFKYRELTDDGVPKEGRK